MALVLLTGCHDSRYDECARKNPLTVDYRACVKAFQDQDADDAAVSSAMSAAVITSTMN